MSCYWTDTRGARHEFRDDEHSKYRVERVEEIDSIVIYELFRGEETAIFTIHGSQYSSFGDL